MDMENKHKWTVQKCPCTDPDCNRYTVESNFMSKNDAELIAASAPSLQSEIDQLKNELKFSEDRADKRLDAYAKMADVATELKSEIDRLKEEKKELIEVIKKAAKDIQGKDNGPEVGLDVIKNYLEQILTRIK